MTVRDYAHKGAGRESRPYRCSVKFIAIPTIITITADIQGKEVDFYFPPFLTPLKRVFLARFSWYCPPLLTEYLHYECQIQYHKMHVFCYPLINPCL